MEDSNNCKLKKRLSELKSGATAQRVNSQAAAQGAKQALPSKAGTSLPSPVRPVGTPTRKLRGLWMALRSF